MGHGADLGLTQLVNTDLIRDGWSAINRLGDEITDKADLLAWHDYTPALTASVNPTMGASPTLAGRYVKIGRTVIGYADIKFGASGSAGGNGIYAISLPPFAAVTASYPKRVGMGDVYHAGAAALVRVYLANSTTVNMFYTATTPTGTQTQVSSTTPWTWTNNDELHVNFQYEATS